MGFFGRRKKTRFHRDGRVDLHTSGSAKRLANERVRKVAASKFAQGLRSFFIVSLALVVLLGLLGVLGLVGYSLKSGQGQTLGEKLTGFLRITPFGFLVKEGNTKQQTFNVVGIQGIPEFPDSTFVFADYINRVGDFGFSIKKTLLQDSDAQALYDFLTNGQSVYRLPPDGEWLDVQAFYREKLVEQGWKFELSVPVTDTEKIPGEYYTKDEKGLHVYSIASDVWYEVITKVQAEQGLHDKIVAYKAKQELVEAASGRDLPPEAAWKLRYSRDWDVELSKNVIYGVNNIYFTHDSTKERLTISVLNRYRGNVADITYKDLDKFGVEFISTWLTTQQTTVTLSGFTKNELIVADSKALEYSDLKNRAYFLFLVNKKNSLVYVVQYIGKEKPEFFEFIKGNLKN